MELGFKNRYLLAFYNCFTIGNVTGALVVFTIIIETKKLRRKKLACFGQVYFQKTFHLNLILKVLCN